MEHSEGIIEAGQTLGTLAPWYGGFVGPLCFVLSIVCIGLAYWIWKQDQAAKDKETAALEERKSWFKALDGAAKLYAQVFDDERKVTTERFNQLYTSTVKAFDKAAELAENSSEDQADLIKALGEVTKALGQIQLVIQMGQMNQQNQHHRG